MVQTRTFVIAPPRHEAAPPNPPPSKTQKGKRKIRVPGDNARDVGNGRKKRKTKGKGKAKISAADEGEEELNSGSDEDPNIENQSTINFPRRSGRPKKLVAGGYLQEDEDEDVVSPAVATSIDIEMTAASDIESVPAPRSEFGNAPWCDTVESVTNPAIVKDEPKEPTLGVPSTEVTDVDVTIHEQAPVAPSSSAIDIDLEIEEDEQKPKPILQLKYQGFGIYGHCLCIVVEPWPPNRSATRAPSVAPLGTTLRAPSIAPPNFVPSGEKNAGLRARTPLFLPEDADRRSETPAPFLQHRVLPRVPLFNESSFDDEEGRDSEYDGGMMELSQVLTAGGDFRAGAAEDDDEMDGAVFFGDADEAREL